MAQFNTCIALVLSVLLCSPTPVESGPIAVKLCLGGCNILLGGCATCGVGAAAVTGGAAAPAASSACSVAYTACTGACTATGVLPTP